MLFFMLVNMIRANDKQEKKWEKERKKKGNFNLLPSVQSLISLRNIFRGFFVAASGKFIADKVFFVINILEKRIILLVYSIDLNILTSPEA